MSNAATFGIIDYGGGNLRSVQNALRSLGVEPVLISSPEALAAVDAVIFPGQGAFGDCMRGLQSRGLVGPLRDWIRAARSFLGICIGYQVLFESSEENPGVEGLGILGGTVVRFPRRSGLKVPHMGWNTVELATDHPVWEGLGTSPCFYFVHSYYPVPSDAGCIAGRTDYDGKFACAVSGPGFFGAQFHPEKSQSCGLRLIGNFVRLHSEKPQPASTFSGKLGSGVDTPSQTCQ